MTQDWKEDSMSHVDEGTLHAYLDGELPSSERAALEAHLAQCAACRATLDDERALLERASALLESARPVERPAPPFAQLRRSPQRPLRRVRMPVAWAASIMLALGLGYYLRDPGKSASLATPPLQPQSAVVAEDRAASPEAQTPAVERGGAQQERRAETRRRAAAPPAPPAAAAGAVALKSAPQLRNAAPALEEAPARDAKDSLVLQGVAAVRGRAVTTQWPIISRGAAASLLGTDPVGLPGLATRRIRRSPAPDATVVVEQALDSSTVIQIFQRPANSPLYFVDGTPLQQTERDRAAREAAPAAAPAPADRLARFVGRLRVEIAGPLTPDSLNRLLEQVEPLP